MRHALSAVHKKQNVVKNFTYSFDKLSFELIEPKQQRKTVNDRRDEINIYQNTDVSLPQQPNFSSCFSLTVI